MLTRAAARDIDRAFPGFPLDSIPADIPAWLEPRPWPYDTCPAWMTADEAIAVWIDWPHRADRDRPHAPRFAVEDMRGGFDLLETDDWSAVLAFLATINPEA